MSIFTKSFSALQRAENSSILGIGRPVQFRGRFQCSSASRKFLNQCARRASGKTSSVSVLFSEPKIPQCRFSSRTRRCGRVSVLFSEPKIPQWKDISRWEWVEFKFQCSSASRKFLNRSRTAIACTTVRSFSALQRAENSSIAAVWYMRRREASVSVLFSEPKIPQ